jgi:hypothetical protein
MGCSIVQFFTLVAHLEVLLDIYYQDHFQKGVGWKPVELYPAPSKVTWNVCR